MYNSFVIFFILAFELILRLRVFVNPFAHINIITSVPMKKLSKTNFKTLVPIYDVITYIH